jgi:predicted secreted protein
MSPAKRRKQPVDTRSERVSLDQLLGESGDWAPAKPRVRRWWVRDLVIAAVTAGALYSVIRVGGLDAPYHVLFSVVFAFQLLRRALVAVPVTPPPPAVYSPAWGVADDEARLAPVDGVVRAVQRWEARFGWTERDAARFTSAVHPRLYELVDERLRQRHGITLRNDPAGARALIGEQLWTFLHARTARTPSAREMAALVGEMEKI